MVLAEGVTAWLPRAEAFVDGAQPLPAGLGPPAQARAGEVPPAEAAQGAAPALRVLYVERLIAPGVVNTMPVFAFFAVLFAMANSGLPGTSGFVGEWMVILGTVKANFWLAALAATALIFGAAYNLWMVKRVYFGEAANEHVKALTDINPREFLMLALLAIAVLWMGVYPKPFTDVMHVSVTQLLQHVAQSKLN